jgi:hypothetical protein
VSTAANPGLVKAGPRLAPFFVGFMALSAAMILVQVASGTHDWHRREFLGLVIAGAVSSRLKVKFPGLNGNMSVNLPFIFIAMTQLSVGEALLVALVSVFIQSIPQALHKFVPVQVLFNLSTALVAAGLGWHAFRFVLDSHRNVPAALALSCATHFLVSTVPVAVILSLVDKRPAIRTWINIVQLSFPYYLASTGLVSIAAGVGDHTGLPTLLGVTCIMFVTYRSYRLYFGAVRTQLG